MIFGMSFREISSRNDYVWRGIWLFFEQAAVHTFDKLFDGYFSQKKFLRFEQPHLIRPFFAETGFKRKRLNYRLALFSLCG